VSTGPDIRGKAFIAGAFEHPRRDIPDLTVAEIHAAVALGALEDAGLTLADVDGYFCDSTFPGMGAMSMAGYLGLRLSFADSTELGGACYVAHVGHATAAIAAGKCRVALVTLAGKPRQAVRAAPGAAGPRTEVAPDAGFEQPWGMTTPSMYALAASRHMYEYGTTSEQLAMVKVAASLHAQHNPNAFLPHAVSVEEVLDSPVIASPLHRLDCCVVTDGGGALVVVAPEVARDLRRPKVKVLGHGEAIRHTGDGRIDLTHTGAVWSGPRAFEMAGVAPGDVDYASIYDSFTITVLETVEDLRFCPKGAGGAFVESGALVAPHGALPFNTDGGGLCSNHPSDRGGMTKVIEAVRQLRGEAHPAVQVPDCRIALAHGTGGSLSLRSASATLILGQEDA
jgi:acetyl-CoA C-acetyltransferase